MKKLMLLTGLLLCLGLSAVRTPQKKKHTKVQLSTAVVELKTHVFVLSDTDSMRFYFTDQIDQAYRKGTLKNSPVVAIDGIVFDYNKQQDTIYLPLRKEELGTIDFLHHQDSHIIYGAKATNGAIIINRKIKEQLDN